MHVPSAPIRGGDLARRPAREREPAAPERERARERERGARDRRLLAAQTDPECEADT
jgi:hypothetical protein